MNLLVKYLVVIGSSISICFGIWHFFVPQVWKWYSYIDGNATELVAAIRAINAFFSLLLVLFGTVNILLIYGDKSNRYSIIVMLAANMRIVDHPGGISGDLSTRFAVSGSPIRDVVSLCNYYFVLPDLLTWYLVPKNTWLTQRQ